MSDGRFPPTLGRLPLHRRNDAIARLNRFAVEGRPFVFLVDYAAEQAVVEPLDALSPDELAYDFGGITNVPSPGGPTAVGHPRVGVAQPAALTPHLPAFSDYARAFALVQGGLRRGDSFLTNLTQQVPIETPLTLADIFARARARYRLFVPGRWVCFSPEPLCASPTGTSAPFP
mgnify:FL=1